MGNSGFDLFPSLAKFLISLGIFFLLLGVLLFLLPRLGLFKLPGDISLKGRNFTLYLPIATSLLLSVLLTIILNLILRIKR